MLIDKPKGWTSHDVVAKLRNISNIRKIGHAGTLDPMATGLLICAIGREFTKQLAVFLKQDKIYLAKIRLGASSDTYDREGKIEVNHSAQKPKLKEIKQALAFFTGAIKQVPPRFSAKKINGLKSYQLARAGRVFDLKPNRVDIHNIGIIAYRWPNLDIRVHCGSGCYIRSLAHDLGQVLKSGGYLKELKRIKIGEIDLSRAHRINIDINRQNWQRFLV